MTQEHRPRRIKLIDRKFQVGLMIKFILIHAAILAAFSAGLYLFMHGEIQSNLQSAHVSYRTVGSMLFPIILTLSLLILAILAATIVFVILYASHRIAGPLYRFRQTLLELSQRNLRAPTRIRDDDQLAEVAHALEKARDRWSADVAQLQCTVSALRAELAAPSPAVAKSLADLQALLDSYAL